MTTSDPPGDSPPATITVPVDLNGPAGSGNGGVAAGLLGRMIDGPARVRLFSPPPLGIPMEVLATTNGLEARVDGEAVLSAVPARVDVEVPAVTREQAESATAPFVGHLAVNCFVCGPENTRGLRLLPGPVDGGPVHATTWTPAEWMVGPDGAVPPEIVWGVLDCPGAIMFARHYPDEEFFAALGTMAVDIIEPIRAGETYSVLAWPLGRDGRKLYAGTALTGAAGNVHALSDQVCIAMPFEWGGTA